MTASVWWVYVLRSESGAYYVGCTTDIHRRVRQHNGEIVGGAKCTRSNRPWRLAKAYGSYANRSEALKAEYALKRGKRGICRTRWCESDSIHYRESNESRAFTEIVSNDFSEMCPIVQNELNCYIKEE